MVDANQFPEVKHDESPRFRDYSTIGPDEIENRFGFHKGTIEGPNATAPKHAEMRVMFRDFAEYLDKVLPPGRAKSVAFTELETAAMWAHKAVAETAPVDSESGIRYVD